jgi:hypothetical protein
MLTLASKFIPVCLIAVSAFASPCGSKIDPALCNQMANLSSTTLVPIQILLPQPPFNYPNKMDVSPDSARNYSLMVQDSMGRHLKAIEPQIDSLFVKHVLLSVTTGQRLSPPNISYDYFLDVKASVATINQMAQENLIARIGLLSAPGVPTTVPNLTILSTRFPFDTVFTGLITDNGTLLTDTVVIARYGMKFKFGPLPTSPICCPQDIAFDFGLSTLKDNRFPQDWTTLLSGGSYNGSVCSPPCTSYVNIDSSYRTHEYRFTLGDTLEHVLCMKVMDGSKPDSIKVRFDTSSFLPITKIRSAPAKTNPSPRIGLTWENGFVTVRGIQPDKDCKISIYNVAGKKLFGSVSKGRNNRFPVPISPANGIFFIKISTNQGIFLFKKNLMK